MAEAVSEGAPALPPAALECQGQGPRDPAHIPCDWQGRGQGSDTVWPWTDLQPLSPLPALLGQGPWLGSGLEGAASALQLSSPNDGVLLLALGSPMAGVGHCPILLHLWICQSWDRAASLGPLTPAPDMTHLWDSGQWAGSEHAPRVWPGRNTCGA